MRLKEIDNPQIVHYGAYENRFRKHMRERRRPPAEDAELLHRLINEFREPAKHDHVEDLLSIIFEQAEGSCAVAWVRVELAASLRHRLHSRRCWQLTLDDMLKRQLITYNIEDRRAAGVVTAAIARICGTSEAGSGTKLELVNVLTPWKSGSSGPSASSRVRSPKSQEDQLGCVLGLPEV